MIVKSDILDSERLAMLCAEDFKSLGISEGELLKIKGRRTVCARACIAPEGKLKADEIGLGARLQARVGSTNGSEVKVEKTTAESLKRVQFLASTDAMPGDGSISSFQQIDKPSMSQNIKLAINSLAHMPLRKGEGITITPLELAEIEKVVGGELLAPEMNRLVMDKTVYIKIVETEPSGEVVCNQETEWCEADLHQFLHGNMDISFSQIGGLELVKEQLRNAVEGPIKNAGAYSKWKVRPTKGILLFGPPGCGKTMIAKAVAKELEAELIYVRGSEIYTPYFGASEGVVREIFRYARTFQRAVIFWDEFDAVGTARSTAGNNSRLFDTVLNSLLVEMDGMGNNQNVIVIAATNRLDQLDPALMRPGRFDFTVRVPLPTEQDRLGILKIYLEGKPGADKINLGELAAKTTGYTGADLENLVRVACIEAIEKACSDKILPEHVEKALAGSRPSLTKEQVEYYEQMISGKGNPSVGNLPMFR